MDITDQPEPGMAAAEALVDREDEAAPARLRERVLAGALRRRPAGRPAAVESITAVEAYRRTVDELDDLLAQCRPDDWSALVEPYGWTVQGMVGHLLGIERMLATRLGVDDFAVPADLDVDHLRATDEVVATQADRGPADTLTDWRTAAERVRRALAAPDAPDMDDRVSLHGISYRWSSLLVVRSLEVWTHTDDIRRALGRPLVAPDAARLSLMTDLAVRTLPLRLALTGEASTTNGTVRMVLTGPGGGVWQETLGTSPGATAGEPAVRIVADAVGFCRLSAGRLSVDDLAASVEGDENLAAAVFTTAAAFAV